MILVVMLVFSTFYRLGYIQIGTNGQIYVQDTQIKSDTEDQVGDKVSDKLNVLDQVLDSFYFDDASESEIEDNIYKAYIDSFDDKYTVYYSPSEYKAITQSTSGTYYGIGVVVSKNEDGTIKVVQPYQNCPGYEAGMRAGDTITKVAGISVMDRDLTAVVADIKGSDGSTVEVEIVREGIEEPMVLTVERRKIEVPTIFYEMRENNIGYIDIAEFDEVTEKQFIAAYKDLQTQGMQGLIVDVRSNPGGLLTTVVNILDEILPDGLIVYTEDKDGKKIEYSGKNKDEIGVPMAVLVNGDSASASEIFAGAIQDYGVGTVIGTQTFGKGIVQTIKPLTDGSAVKFTVAKYFTPKGQDIHGKGVTPDIKVEIASGKSYLLVDREDDTQYQTAISYLKDKMK